MSDHVASRPRWQCSCGDPWPCLTRQNQLLAEHEGRRSEVGDYLTRIYPQMRADLNHLDAGDVYRRLFGWLSR